MLKYNKYKKKSKFKTEVFFVLSILFLLFSIFIYAFDRIVMPTVIIVAESEIKAKVSEIISANALLIYKEGFNYDELVKIEKDVDGYITMVRTDTLKMNNLASSVALKSQKDISNIGNMGIKFPIGYITKNNIMSYWGPKITIKMEPIGHTKTSYDSKFETAGINQTRHKIYLNMESKVRIIIPLQSREVELKTEIPIVETIIVGKVPRTNIDLDPK
ncbi:sporulation protein YunB [Clostridium amylolyticum]|uniref:Sporulation protein YunB n=1 Tax=Clostridium amylolyticum TaxID=1121298 RepID=A0A1M6CU90_9CLOT|nr:sporulation protein YunB [Clostridium amylolyticum]SHI64520.1 sporulation protein YunB [Clostridium amylolyticum]